MEKTMVQPSIDRGPLRLNSIGRWAIARSNPHEQPFAELSSGSRVFLEVGGKWRLTRIEYSHAAKAYVSIDGYRLAEGIMSALPTG
jgi:hypothetical protein